MNRYEFIQSLRAALTGKVPGTTVEDNVRYYEEYIDIQLRQGKSEEEILGALGDPRLLAKTIIEANKHAEGLDFYGNEEEYQDGGESGGSGKTFWEWYMERPKWVHSVMTILVMLLVLFLVFSLVSALFPVICVFFVIVFLLRLFRRSDW